ncbi:sigma-54 interaction domain-containing protein [Crassaminicella profunda]|uniref:sigma-54 interaction domain-containing protein n=1 Tax=Crassaminicella profunda TaxID=1286698 RepID=UPI001CA7385D|nr:sigma 54-interacting transcriptional regulator [Crassaminicella profunda]QZY54946.1 sigma 54-interacting transcriptional regulator [Crassaminicella profunda]
MSDNINYELDRKTFFNLINHMYDEVFIYDTNYRVVYVNEACKRHYGRSPEELIGKSFFDLTDAEWWNPSILPIVFETKKTHAIRQKTLVDAELLTIATPIFDDKNKIKYVIMNVRDPIYERDLYNPQYIDHDHAKNNTNLIPIYKSKKMQKVLDLIKKVSTVDITCLLQGESGTGKSLLAKFMHSISPRHNKPFINVNCATIPSNLIESELFGYEKGAFTGAVTHGKKGLLEAAEGGTILLDEISELPYNAQAKLLHVIQNKEFIPIGTYKAKKVNVKIISATNKDLRAMVASGQFREDLYYRLNVIDVYIPPLRQRKEDIEPLIYYFLNTFSKKYNTRHEISPAAINILLNCKWKGNVRELQHIIERLVVTIDEMIIDVKHLPKHIFEIVDSAYIPTTSENMSFDEIIGNYEKLLVCDAYNKGASSRRVAEQLGISQTRALKLINKYIKKSPNGDS